MRLLSLHLDRYGPFSGKRLNFRPDAKLHVVFGRNEAGKSSSLSAVTDLLFGVQRHTPDDFLRPGRDMRLGATIRDSHGAELTFWRRKLKPLLSDSANAALPDDALAPFLGGLSREVFRRAFGLDAEALRRSGDELKTSGGELGAALFSAASGLRGVIDIKNAMEREADGIFGERRSQSRTFYQAADRYEAARKGLREHETRVGALKVLREELVGQENLSEAIAQRRAAIVLDRGKLDRLRRAAPILHAIDAGEAQLATLGPLPSAPEGSGVALVESVRAVENAADAMAEAQRNESRLRDEHEAIVLDQPLLDSADEVERLQTALGEYRKGQRDLPAIERDEHSAGQQLAALASRLGFSDVEMLLTRQPDDAALARVDNLVMHGRRLDQALDTRLDELRRERAALEERRRERARRAAPPDPRLLRERLTALGELRRLAERVDEHVTAIAAEEATLDHAAARLAPKIADLGALASVSLPSRDTIAVFATRLSQLDEEARRERQALEAAQREATEFSNRLEILERGAPLPTLERIASARVERDRHWLALRAVVFGETGAISGQALASEAAGFEATRSEADALADAAILDAQRVAAHAEMSRERVRREAIVAERTEGLAVVEGQKQAVLADWASAWTPSGVVPLSPAEMASWLLVVTSLLDRYAKLNDRKAQERRILGQIETARPALAALIVDLGLSLVPGLPVPSELKRAESEIDRISEGWDAARTSDTLMADLATRVGKAEVEAEAARESVDRWRLEFREALPRIGLRDDAAIVEAEACLAAWREAPAIASERERLKRRVAGIKRDAARFTHDVDALIAAVAPDLAGPPDQALRLLGQRLTQTRAAEATRDAMIRRVAEVQTAARAAVDKHDRSKRALVGLAERLGLSSESGVAEVSGALAKRDEIVALLRQRRSELANAADGRDEAELRAALSGYAPDMADAEVVRLEEEAHRLENESREAYAAAKEAGGRIDSLSGAVAAEVALQQRCGAESEMLEAAREWAVLSIGAVMIGAAMTRLRQARQEPLMARAGQLFATLTGGSYLDLGQAFDENDIPYLVGRRAGDAEIKISEMSDGARDQLFFALRLAYVEDFAARAEPPPFLADDLFASFDDERTASGLRALAGIGERVQPILFTHHHFVVETAMRELGDAADVLEIS